MHILASNVVNERVKAVFGLIAALFLNERMIKMYLDIMDDDCRWFKADQRALMRNYDIEMNRLFLRP